MGGLGANNSINYLLIIYLTQENGSIYSLKADTIVRQTPPFVIIVTKRIVCNRKVSRGFYKERFDCTWINRPYNVTLWCHFCFFCLFVCLFVLVNSSMEISYNNNINITAGVILFFVLLSAFFSSLSLFCPQLFVFVFPLPL